MQMNIMLSVVKENRIDCPEGLTVYHRTPSDAIKTGIEYCKNKDIQVFIVRKVQAGHYRTIGYYGPQGNRLN